MTHPDGRLNDLDGFHVQPADAAAAIEAARTGPVAEGNVALVRDRPDANGGPPTRAVGRSEKAIYIAATGDVELTGTPRVQEGPNTHVATSPDTVMIVNQNGQLTTHGPSRTEIRQEPKTEENEKKAKASPSPKP